MQSLMTCTDWINPHDHSLSITVFQESTEYWIDRMFNAYNEYANLRK